MFGGRNVTIGIATLGLLVPPVGPAYAQRDDSPEAQKPGAAAQRITEPFLLSNKAQRARQAFVQEVLDYYKGGLSSLPAERRARAIEFLKGAFKNELVAAGQFVSVNGFSNARGLVLGEKQSNAVNVDGKIAAEFGISGADIPKLNFKYPGALNDWHTVSKVAFIASSSGGVASARESGAADLMDMLFESKRVAHDGPQTRQFAGRRLPDALEKKWNGVEGDVIRDELQRRFVEFVVRSKIPGYQGLTEQIRLKLNQPRQIARDQIWGSTTERRFTPTIERQLSGYVKDTRRDFEKLVMGKGKIRLGDVHIEGTPRNQIDGYYRDFLATSLGAWVVRFSPFVAPQNKISSAPRLSSRPVAHYMFKR